MEKEKPHVEAEMECPVLHKKEKIGFDVNVLRGPNHGGLDVTTCSEFNHGEVTCGKYCIHTQEARELHEKEFQKFQRELVKIGLDVIAAADAHSNPDLEITVRVNQKGFFDERNRALGPTNPLKIPTGKVVRFTFVFEEDTARTRTIGQESG
jgi:hypothetical protein